MDLPDFTERKFISILLKFLRTSKKTKFFSLNLIEEKNITEIKFLLTLQLESFTEEKFFLAIMRAELQKGGILVSRIPDIFCPESGHF